MDEIGAVFVTSASRANEPLSIKWRHMNSNNGGNIYAKEVKVKEIRME